MLCPFNILVKTATTTTYIHHHTQSPPPHNKFNHNHHHHTVQVAICAYSFMCTVVNVLVLQGKKHQCNYKLQWLMTTMALYHKDKICIKGGGLVQPAFGCHLRNTWKPSPSGIKSSTNSPTASMSPRAMLGQYSGNKCKYSYIT